MHKQIPIVIIIIGMLLLGIGSLPGCETEKETKEPSEAQLLSEILSRVAGAGKVFVFMTYEDKGEIVPVYDQENHVVILRRDSEVLGAIREKLPKVSGVLIVAEGAGDSRVRAELIASVRALYGTELDRISVLQGKSLK